MLSIKVLGPGCANCRKVEEVVRRAVSAMGVEATIVKVSDYAAMMDYGLLATPGLVINEKLVAGGRIPAESEVRRLINSALATP